MNQSEIPKAYNPGEVEDSIYEQWEESGFFNPDNLPDGHESFTISMPPPNATGVLHVGHAVMLALQDIVIRYQRMKGKKTLWLPGTDHAAIATQTKVERLIKEKEGKTRHDLGREEFLKRVEAFVAQSQNTIRNQIRKMGSSCDWSRERYTLDAGLTRSVGKAFVQMYNDGLIYRGNRIVSWCPRCYSTLADDEVEYKEQKAKLYYIKYGPLVIATTRPETKLGDTAAAVNPGDQRYQAFIGQELPINLGLVNIKVKLIADELVDPEFGTGVLGVTPAHSLVDFEMAQKNKLSVIQVIGPDGKMTAKAGPYAGLSVSDCRTRFVEDLKKAGLIEKIEEVDNSLSICYRCGTSIEPLPSKQWFIDVNKPVKKFGGKTIKQRALAVVQDGDIEIIPKRFEKVYYHWLDNLRDWCISRQIWFGHRIPVWYKESLADGQSEEIYVGIRPPAETGWAQDPDTLDTWFSSGLWTFSTLGWPDKTDDMKNFHPTSLMETGYDILFFWVARMIIMSTYFLNEIPFKHVYLHGLIRDEDGRKMSKSLDNVIDPLDVISEFGADAVRLSLVIGNTPGNDMNLSKSKIAGCRNFVNKLWNISRYILISVEVAKVVIEPPKPKTLADRWILAELAELISFATKNLDKYNFSAAGEKIYEFTWAKVADWYLEISKIEKGKDEILLYILTSLLKLWHPFTPFVTEEIWRKLTGDNLLMIQSWPKVAGKTDGKAIKEFEIIKDIVTAIRNLRSENKIPPAKKIPAVIISKSAGNLILAQSETVKNLARLEDLTVADSGKKPSASLSAVIDGVEIYLPVFGIIDIKEEKIRLEKEVKRIEEFIQHLSVKLENKHFLDRAPKEIIEVEKNKLNVNQESLEKIKQQLKTLS